jgi:hypothetical protein
MNLQAIFVEHRADPLAAAATDILQFKHFSPLRFHHL